MRRFFLYGTLMDPDVFAAVSGLDPSAVLLTPARLDGYQRHGAKGRLFPMVRRRNGAAIDGRLTDDLPEAAAVRLVWYERALYGLTDVTVSADSTGEVRAWLFDPYPGALPPGGGWDFEAWVREHKTATLARLAPLIRRAPRGPEMATAETMLRRAIAELEL